MRAWVIGFGLLAAGCGGDGKTPADGSPAGTGDTGTPTTETGEDTGPLPPSCAEATTDVLRGTLTDLDGAPVADLSIKFCNALGCRITLTDASGAYCYDGVVPSDYSFVPAPAHGTGLAHPLTVISFASGETRTLDLVVPRLDAEASLPASPQEFELGSGLFVTVGDGDLTSPDPFLPEAETVAGVQVPQAAWPPIEGVPGTPLAVWYTDPFDYDAPNGLPFRIEDQWQTPNGATRELWVASYGDFGWLKVADLVAQDGWLTSAAELPLLSTFVLVDPG